MSITKVAGTFLWSTASKVARSLADSEVLKRERLDCRVISVGNIQAGGAGKTPLVAEIARKGVERGLAVAILSRGYGGSWENKGGELAPGSAPANAAQAGDEPALLHDLVPQAWIGIGADRVASYRKIRERHKIDLVILDDGFQHWKIHKDLEIVALTSAKPGETLFRDRQEALWFADLLVWTKGDTRPPDEGKPMVKVRFRIPAPAQPGKSHVLVTGLADGESALAGARDAGYDIRKHVKYSDHARYSKAGVDALLRDAKDAGARVALTGKDWVKWRELGVAAADVTVLEPALHFEEGEELWNQSLWGR